MTLINLIVILAIVGVLMYLVNTYVPMSAGVKKLLNIAVVVVLVLWLLKAFGLLDSVSAVGI